jgi:hypothetical protein
MRKDKKAPSIQRGFMNNKPQNKTGAYYTIHFRRASDDKQAVLYVSRDWRDHTILYAKNIQYNIKLSAKMIGTMLCIIRIIVTHTFCL